MANKLKFSSTKLKAELQRRQRELLARQREFVIWVPPILYFWYPQEFGTGRQLEKDSGLSHPPSKIPAKPGLRPRAMVRKALPDIRLVLSGTVRKAFRLLGVQPSVTMNTALATAMEAAKAFIALSFKKELPGTRETGKLKGRSAGDVFFAEARVIERDVSGASPARTRR